MGAENAFSRFTNIDLAEMRKPGFLSKMTDKAKGWVDKVNNGHGWQDVLQCPVCNFFDRTFEFSKFDVDIMRCANCGLRYTNKIPNDISDIYSEYLNVSLDYYASNADYRKDRFAKERVELINNYTGSDCKKRILDIGCGTGWFLDYAQGEGYDVFGQEFSAPLAAWTTKNLGIPVYNCAVEEINEKNKFDVITMFDLIEHVVDPVLLIKNCKRLLNTDGIILIFTPNFDSLAISIQKELSNLIIPGEHLTYFTKSSVEHLAKVTDMDLGYYVTCGIDMGDLKSFYELQGDFQIADACSYFYDKIQPFIDASQSGNHMRFILQKKDD